MRKERKEFSVLKRQEPVHARMTGLGKGCRRMLDPPLVLQLKFKEKELSRQDLALLVSRWSLKTYKQVYMYSKSDLSKPSSKFHNHPKDEKTDVCSDTLGKHDNIPVYTARCWWFNAIIFYFPRSGNQGSGIIHFKHCSFRYALLWKFYISQI